MLKLNLGSGEYPLPCFENLDIKDGKEIYPLPYDDESVDVVRASHVLEHFGHREIKSILTEWVRVLKPGGMLKIAVPDFGKVAQGYLDGEVLPIQGYVMGGQVDEHDFHKTIFDEAALQHEMESVGLINIKPWVSEQQDAAKLDISLNLCGSKPIADISDEDVAARCKTIGASMSMPRLAFTDNYFSAFNGLMPLGIQLRKQTGAFWGQCLERSIDEWIKEGKQWVLTMDYDTIFTMEDVKELVRLSIAHPGADAIAPIQAHRTKQTPLMTIRRDNKAIDKVAYEEFEKPLLRVSTAHFGLTLINIEKITQMKRPLFLGVPNEEGRWGEGREDDDIYFWRRWEDAGNTLYMANSVPVGHAELMIRWPDKQLSANYQHPSDFWADGKPQWCWREE